MEHIINFSSFEYDSTDSDENYPSKFLLKIDKEKFKENLSDNDLENLSEEFNLKSLQLIN